jgi:hypothetical protein
MLLNINIKINISNMTEKEHDVDYADPEEEQKIAPVCPN